MRSGKLNILITSIDNPYLRGGSGGKQTHIRLFASGLEALGHQVRILYPSNSNIILWYILKVIEKFAKSILGEGTGIILRYYFSDVTIATRAFFLFLFQKIDYVIAQDSNSVYYSAKIAKIISPFTGVCMTVHGYATREAISRGMIKKNSSAEKSMKKLEQRGYSVVDKFIAVDTRIANYLKTLGHNAIKIQFNAIDEQAFQPISDADKLPIRRKYSIGKDRIVILIPRRLVPKNGPYVALDAAKLAKDKSMDNLLFVFAGNGPEFENMQIFIRENAIHDLVLMLGNIPHAEMKNVVSMSDIVMVPSVSSYGVEEATSLAALEGMACKKIVLVSNVGGLPEIVKNGDTGFVFEEKQAEAIIQLITYTLKNPTPIETMKDNAFRYIQDNHKYVNHANKIMTYFSS